MCVCVCMLMEVYMWFSTHTKDYRGGKTFFTCVRKRFLAKRTAAATPYRHHVMCSAAVATACTVFSGASEINLPAKYRKSNKLSRPGRRDLCASNCCQIIRFTRKRVSACKINRDTEIPETVSKYYSRMAKLYHQKLLLVYYRKRSNYISIRPT